MRLPKAVQIAGITYKVEKKQDGDGGSFNIAKQLITVGVKTQRDDRIFQIFLHEVFEVLLIERRLRLTNSDNQFCFILSHQDMENFAGDIATVILPLVMKGKVRWIE